MTNNSKSKPPYLLGLLCLFPLLGAFVGLTLLFFGIFHYKSKLLTIIGAMGILFTVGLYSFLIYNSKHGELSKQQFAKISQMDLNNLVNNLELYKQQYGDYPDSLQQLLQHNKFIQIADAIQQVQEQPNIYFNYKKVGNNYTLFSSGQDGIANTKDDLFPILSNSDSLNLKRFN